MNWKTITLSHLFCFYFTLVNAQVETVNYKTIAQSLQENYNTEDFESIFSLYSAEMKKALPLPNTISFFTGLRAQAGKIERREFVALENQGTASYKTTFENGIFTLLISLNNQGEIAGLLLKPYKAPINAPTNIISNKLNAESPGISQEQSSIIFNKINSFPDQTQLAIALIKNGEVTFFGSKRERDAIIAVKNADKAFEIGSITKVFTSTLLAGLVIDNQLQLEDPINNYLDFDLNGGQEISFLSLANHSSGLPRLPPNLNLLVVDPQNPYADYNELKLKNYLQESLEMSSSEEPQYQYSNLGAGLLAYVMSKSQNITYETMLQDRIFTKYGMLSSSTDRENLEDLIIIGLDSAGNEVPLWDFSSLKGAGAILSTAQDLSKFALAQFSADNLELLLTQTKTFDIDPSKSTGLGWHILTGQNLLFHSGGTGGYSSYILLDARSKNGIIILSNISAFHPNSSQIEVLSFELFKSLE